MRTYIIYDMQTDEVIGEIEAASVLEAERKASEKFDRYSTDIYAMTK